MVYFARFLERLHGFFGKLRNCLCMLFLCLDSLSLPFYVCVLGAKTPVPFFLGFLYKKKHLEQKNRVSREDGPRFVFANVVACFLERASTRRSLALFAERGSFRNPLDFLWWTSDAFISWWHLIHGRCRTSDRELIHSSSTCVDRQGISPINTLKGSRAAGQHPRIQHATCV
jgi:hypothetical protein